MGLSSPPSLSCVLFFACLSASPGVVCFPTDSFGGASRPPLRNLPLPSPFMVPRVPRWLPPVAIAFTGNPFASSLSLSRRSTRDAQCCCSCYPLPLCLARPGGRTERKTPATAFLFLRPLISAAVNFFRSLQPPRAGETRSAVHFFWRTTTDAGGLSVSSVVRFSARARPLPPPSPLFTQATPHANALTHLSLPTGTINQPCFIRSLLLGHLSSLFSAEAENFPCSPLLTPRCRGEPSLRRAVPPPPPAAHYSPSSLPPPPPPPPPPCRSSFTQTLTEL